MKPDHTDKNVIAKQERSADKMQVQLNEFREAIQELKQ
jgi:hypothetical protein